MAAAYHPDATFSDPVFPRSRPRRHRGDVGDALRARDRPHDRTLGDLRRRRERAAPTGIATYTYTATKRRVVNRIDATFAFRDGLILRHDDRFSLYRWMRQAFGLNGVLAGWLPPVQRAVRAQAAKALAAYRAKRGI